MVGFFIGLAVGALTVQFISEAIERDIKRDIEVAHTPRLPRAVTVHLRRRRLAFRSAQGPRVINSGRRPWKFRLPNGGSTH
jgi:hypothetical protein